MQGMWFSMNDDWNPDVIFNRLKEICPLKRLDEMPVDEVEKSIHVAFQIIGYAPCEFEKAINCAYRISHADYLFEYIFDVWRCDYEQR